ncbi:DUF3426 domain-containing protein [Marinobacter caseinilyticus]|uniref:DUF3426 domain-containing protein n=1 Tax=Marinobacter caseinilyticus TaxID=2692195 RepID=UPI0014099816|nr:DUF3426 domain-containing protein [Marinobacter caseinilyticus]
MTESTLLTRCPHCDTRFRVTDEQLGVAKGKVRCGNCMNVFNALEHRQESPPESPSATPAQPVKATPSPSPVQAGPESSDGGKPASEDNFVFQDNPDEDATEGRYAGTKLTFSDDELSDSFRSFDEKAPSGFDQQDDGSDTKSVDESWAEAMLFDDTEPTRRPKQQPAAPAPKPKPESAAPAPKPEPEPAIEFEPEPDLKTPEPAADDDFFTVPAGKDESFAATDDLDQPGDNAPLTAGQADEPWDTPYHSLGHEPIAVRHKPSRGWLSRIFWVLVIIGLIGALVSQVVFYQFERLSSIPELRPFYEKGCELAGCELSPLTAIDQIQSRKLVVRTAPEDRNSLIVDAVILNEAEFEQPFPAIGLTFSNLNGDVVAQSLFTPEEYLAGDAMNLSAMPPETPIRIAITIRDPGRDAVNYNITFQPNRR